MAKPTKEQQKLLDRRSHRALGKGTDKAPLTKREFEQLLKKAAQPISRSPKESVPKEE